MVLKYKDYFIKVFEHDTYRKRLQRKLTKFRSILNDNGYDID